MHSKPLRIGILLRNRHDGPGGLERVLQQMIEGLSADAAEVYLYAFRAPKYQGFIQKQANYFALPLPRWLQTEHAQSQGVFRRLLTKGYIALFGSRLFDKMLEDQLDCLITLDLSRQYCQNYRWLKYFKAKSRLPLFTWVHSTLSTMNPRVLQRVSRKIDLLDGHLAISQGMKAEIQAIAPNQQIKVVYNPIAKAEILPRDPKRLLYIGRIDENKQVDRLLRAMTALHGEWHLDIYGSTGSTAQNNIYQSLITELGLQNHVTFHGWAADPWQQVQTAGILLLNSKSESFSLVIAEAMMRGIAVISADSPVGPAELITPGQNGWLYPVNEEAKGIELIQEVLDGKRILPPQAEIQASVTYLETDQVIQRFKKAVIELIETQQKSS